MPRVHVINGGVDEGLLAEVFSNEGIGTLVYANEYQQIRRARRSDVRAIQQLIKSSWRRTSSHPARAPRSRRSSPTTTSSRWTATRSPAWRSTPTRPRRRASSPASTCGPRTRTRASAASSIQFVEAKAREAGLTQLLALSTQAFSFFQSKGGFAEGTPDDLPPARRARYEQSGRRSKVLVKKL